MRGNDCRKSDAGVVKRETIAREEKVWLAVNRPEPLTDDWIAKMTNVASGPRIVGTNAN
jgi:hypothetical protein